MRRILFLSFSLLGLAGCYASEKMGKDIQDTSHDVNQGGIHMDNGALGVRRPPPTTTITSAPLSVTPVVAKPAAAPVAPPPPAQAAPLTNWPVMTPAPTTSPAPTAPATSPAVPSQTEQAPLSM